MMHHEIHGKGKTAMVLLHGGLHNTTLDAPVIARFAKTRKVIAVDLPGHGRTPLEGALSYERMADELAELLGSLDVGRADVLGYSFGGGVALRLGVQHPALVRKLVAAAVPFATDGWFPSVREGFKHLGPALAELMKPSPVYQTYASIAPDPKAFPKLLEKIGALQQKKYDWSAELAKLEPPAMLVYADADAISIDHIARFYELLGGGKRDGGLDGSGRSKASLAILPGRTHYDLFEAPAFVETVNSFLDA
jgi:pimeloyl-ACP methyl ester carboxylesterase